MAHVCYVKNLVQQFKARVCRILEAFNITIYNIFLSRFESIDVLDIHFLCDIGLTDNFLFFQLQRATFQCAAGH